MNTKKVFFGLMAVAFLAMATVSTTVLNEDTVKQETSIKKKGLIKI